ncbi:hypothetical protein DPMN_028757 [Dreissena polymorpha]|uniref:Uncharacterized protein n=1 Tax=Dreissena polymorpha TaxID=45954 RepID=A0A9D4LVA1_DREPO|nr:hypothetical protein DPMN_028757 [Dreissena polymorpha]
MHTRAALNISKVTEITTRDHFVTMTMTMSFPHTVLQVPALQHLRDITRGTSPVITMTTHNATTRALTGDEITTTCPIMMICMMTMHII